jgi:hypothetical protein
MPSKGTEENEQTNRVDGGTPGGSSKGHIAPDQPDAETWNEKFPKMMKTAPPAAIALVWNYFGNKGDENEDDAKGARPPPSKLFYVTICITPPPLP